MLPALAVLPYFGSIFILLPLIMVARLSHIQQRDVKDKRRVSFYRSGRA